MDPNEQLNAAVAAEVKRRILVEDDLLARAMLSGVASLIITWPDDLGIGSTRYELPQRGRARRRAVRLARRTIRE